MILASLSLRKFVPVGYDADAAAYFAAAGITDPTIKGYVNDFVVGLKADGVWSKLHFFYPYIGGTAASHSINLINPATFEVTWFGGVTHSSTGIQGNGTGYGATGYFPSVEADQNSAHLMAYVRTVSTSGFDIGSASSSFFYLSFRHSSNIYYLINGTTTAGDYRYPASNTLGFLIGNRQLSNRTKVVKNSSILETSVLPSLPPNAAEVKLLCRGLTSTQDLFTTRAQGCASCGGGLTDTETTDYYNRVQTLMTQLGRNV